jgi:hypothetical protein
MDREDELVNAAFAAFPKAGRVTAGLFPDPWVRVTIGQVSGEVHVPRQTPDDFFVAEVQAQLLKLKEHLDG